MIIVFQSQAGTPTTVSDLHIVLQRYRTSIYEGLHIVIYILGMLDRNLSLCTCIRHVIGHPYDRPIYYASALLRMLFLNVNFLIRKFLHAIALLSFRCQTEYQYFCYKKMYVLTKHTGTLNIVSNTLLVNYTNLSCIQIYDSRVHRLIWERAYAKHRVTIITIDSNVIKSSVM